MENSWLQDWTNLYVGMLGAASALTGLLFVSISVNLDRVVKMGGVPERGRETLVLMLSVIIVSIHVLTPQSRDSFGTNVLTQSVLQIACLTVLQFRRVTRTEGRFRGHDLLLNTVTNQLPAFLMLAGAVVILQNDDGSMGWLTASLIAAVIAYFSNAWILLVEILR